MCLQETKVEDAAFPLDVLQAAGYEVAIYGQRSYNGVAIAATRAARPMSRAASATASPTTKRALDRRRRVGDLRVVCVYVPNGQELTSDKFPYKLAWYERLRAISRSHARTPTTRSSCAAT